LAGSQALFTESASTEKCKSNFKTRSHDTIYTFKNYFVTVFLVFSFPFSVISGIQTDPKSGTDRHKALSIKKKGGANNGTLTSMAILFYNTRIHVYSSVIH